MIGAKFIRIWLTAAIASAAALALAGPAPAEFPGHDGRILYTNGYDLWLIDPDGTNEQNLTNHTGGGWFDNAPEWSPDGTKIAISNDKDIFVLNADGSGRTNITAGIPGQPPEPAGYYYDNPTWSPDGTRIGFDRAYHDGSQWDLEYQLWIADADGSNPVQLVTSTASAARPKWHPDGTRIAFRDCPFSCGSMGQPSWVIRPDGSGQAPLAAPVDDWSPDGTKILYTAPGVGTRQFSDIFVQNTDGTGAVNLTNTEFLGEGTPSWSPDATQIVYAASRPRIMNADGSSQRRLSENGGGDPDWQPIPINAYPRPKSASPVQISLVPAYQQCTAANRTHGPPLGFASCNPPQQTSTLLTVGDAPAKNTGFVRVGVRVGVPGTPEDEADVHLRGVINDVRLASDLSDYTGDLEISFQVQITDKNNTPHPGGPGAATVQPFTHSQPISCAATADTTVGATCQFQTTVEALIPGAVTEKQRSVWELGQIAVDDANGDAFLRQGLFIP